ncbi:cytochrome P450 [Microbispora sp. NPDC046973]|uniref:cytochrome P450 family protein n=1 Tax=Microbispora sp. NPDC046973 TaxID=3155022 RepID=UPI0033F8BB7A
MTDSVVVQTPPPLVHIDPSGADRHGEAARMRELGPVVRAVLPGDVQMWVVTDYALLADLAADPRVGRDWRQWEALRRGEVPEDWPLLSMIRLNNAMARDGAEHRRLRKPLTRTFTRARVERLRPRIEEIVNTMLDDLPGHAGPDGVVDVRKHYAYPFPMQVICELIGVPEAWWPRFRELIDTVIRADTTAEEYLATQQERHELWQRLFAMRRAEPADDLTSAMIAVNDEDGALTDDELEDTLWMLIGAGHETSISLIVNATRALLTHPDQLALVRDGDAETWSKVIEETLRWDAPVGNFPARFPTEDITVGGVTIPKGDAILAPWSGVNRDPAKYGPDADKFDITRPNQKHLAFGGGPHMCVGPALARLEAAVALPALFARFPDLRLAVDSAELTAVPSIFSNSVTSLPVYLGPSRG